MPKIPTGTTTAAAPSPPGTAKAPPCTMVIFGAGGDLTARLLMPALYNLAEGGLLDDAFSVLGLDVAALDGAAWQARLSSTIEGFTKDPDAEFHPEHIDAAAWSWLMARAHSLRADFTDPATFAALRERVTGSAIFYLAVPARFFGPIADALGEAGLLDAPEGAFRHLVVEKPFGADLASARALNARILARAREDQVFRIDHFMGKEPVQSILAMRFANRLFEPLWRAEHVERVEITAAETIGVEGRGRFYEPTGALRDMVPNHLFQLLAMVAMEPPTSLDAFAIRSEKTRLLRAVAAVSPRDVAFGRYGAGAIGGAPVPGYREEPDVAPDSRTETYAALRLRVENWRWSGVPFLLRTGKRMAARRTEIVLHLRPAPFPLFPEAPGGAGGGATSDRIVLSVAPEQGVEIAFDVKRPGEGMRLAEAATRLDFREAFHEPPDVGYEALLYDCMRGDATLFQRADAIEESWRIVDPVLNGRGPEPEPYPAGGQGPEAAARLGRWRTLG